MPTALPNGRLQLLPRHPEPSTRQAVEREVPRGSGRPDLRKNATRAPAGQPLSRFSRRFLLGSARFQGYHAGLRRAGWPARSERRESWRNSPKTIRRWTSRNGNTSSRNGERSCSPSPRKMPSCWNRRRWSCLLVRDAPRPSCKLIHGPRRKPRAGAARRDEQGARVPRRTALSPGRPAGNSCPREAPRCEGLRSSGAGRVMSRAVDGQQGQCGQRGGRNPRDVAERRNLSNGQGVSRWSLVVPGRWMEPSGGGAPRPLSR